MNKKKILITGYNGFIGKNLVAHLREIDDYELILFGKDNDLNFLEKNIKDVDFIIHLAGINRPKSIEEFYKGNTDFTREIVNLLKKYNLDVPILFSSSIQSGNGTDYGQSKKEAEDFILNYSKDSCVFRLHNVFGKWSKPNYNSVVSTFCYNLSHGLEIKVDDKSKQLELVYIDDVIEEFKRIIKGNMPSDKVGDYCYVSPRYKVSLGELENYLKLFSSNLTSLYVPNTGDEFIKKLFSTFISFVPIPKLFYDPVIHKDDRGEFVELIRSSESGQVSISTSMPGISRGEHYHHTKIEKFVIIKGTARVKIRNIEEDKVYEFDLSEDDKKIFTIPVGYTHNIENISDKEMILLIWANELFDENKPDTYFCEVEKDE